jgi:hypothetical protein
MRLLRISPGHAGKHVIVELKKWSVNVNVWDLGKQMDKYRGALRKVLRTRFPEVEPNIEVVALVGRLPESPFSMSSSRCFGP